MGTSGPAQEDNSCRRQNRVHMILCREWTENAHKHVCF